MKLEIGQKIKAIDTCVMFGSNNEALIIGKEYEIKAMGLSSITIQSEEAVNHTFYLNELNKYFEINSRSFNELKALVISWASQKGILEKGYPEKQALKTLEECGELIQAIAERNRKEVIDAIGDIIVTLIIQSEMQGVDIVECLESAYNVISKRTGVMKNGTFVKE